MKMEELKSLVLQKRPQLSQHFDSERSVLETARSYFEAAPLGVFGAGIRELIGDTIQSKISQLHGEELAKLFKSKFKNIRAFSTADHHGPLSFPLLVNSNLFNSIGTTAVGAEYNLVLSCAMIPLSNVSFPRGWTFKNRKIPLLPSKFTTVITHLMPKSTFQTFPTAIQKMGFQDDEKDFLMRLHEEMHSGSHFESCSSYSDQISILNHRIWPRYFSSPQSKPKLFYLAAEAISETVFLELVLNERSLPLHQIIFDPKLRKIALELMANLPGAKGSLGGGTQLFWGAQADGRPISLHVDSNFLIGKDFELELTPDAIGDALRRRKIYTSQLTFYGLLAFHAGFHLLGGFNQTEVLGKMKAAWKEIGKLIQNREFCRQLDEIQTDGLICGPELITTGGLDTVMNGGISDEEISRISQASFRESIMANLKTILQIVS
jgi:hypothetical protein